MSRLLAISRTFPDAKRLGLLDSLAWRLAAKEESVRYNLTGLPPRGVVVRPEVGPVLRRYARLIRPATCVPLHYVSRGQPLNESV